MPKTDEEDRNFRAYVKQIAAAGADEERISSLLSEFQEKAYLRGRHILIDRMRLELDGFDDRIRFGAKRR